MPALKIDLFSSVGKCPKWPKTTRPIFSNRPNSSDTARICSTLPLRDVQNRPIPSDFARLYPNIVPYVFHEMMTNKKKSLQTRKGCQIGSATFS